MEQQLSINKQRFVLPGEAVRIENSMMNNSNFYEEDGQSKSLYFGLLNVQNTGDKDYVNVIKRVTTYIPEKNHFVVGIIKNRVGDNFLVDINAPMDGVLGGLQFDGASKRNKPNLNSGDLVYTRVAQCSKYLGSKLSCINLGYSTKNALSQLKGGMIVYGLSGKVKIVEQKIELIKKYCQFEVAFGKNDILWFSCSIPKTEMILYNIFSSLLNGCSQQLFQSLLKMLQP